MQPARKAMPADRSLAGQGFGITTQIAAQSQQKIKATRFISIVFLTPNSHIHEYTQGQIH